MPGELIEVLIEQHPIRPADPKFPTTRTHHVAFRLKVSHELRFAGNAPKLAWFKASNCSSLCHIWCHCDLSYLCVSGQTRHEFHLPVRPALVLA
jgi:hypothetical protein